MLDDCQYVNDHKGGVKSADAPGQTPIRAVSASTVARKRAVFSGALRYAVELGHLDSHPMARVSWTAPKNTDEIDRQVVANPKQARTLLTAVNAVMPELTAFFGCMYYAALRPEEALHLREDEYDRPKRKGGWGWLHLTGATVAVGNGWGDADGTIEHPGAQAPRPQRDPRRSGRPGTLRPA